MFLKIKSMLIHIKTYLSVSVSDPDYKEFAERANKLNISRGKLTALMFMLSEIFLLAVTAIIKGAKIWKPPTFYYMEMYLLQFLAMLLFYYFFSKFEKDISRYQKVIQPFGVFFTGFILCWCAGISILDQRSSGQIMVYAIAAIAVAVAPVLHPLIMLSIFLPVQTAFLIMLILVSPYPTLPFGNCVNSSVLVVVAWFIAFMRYKKYMMEFRNEKLIEEKNAELSRMNAELKKANKALERLSKVDSLTGVFNRSAFDSTIALEWNRCKRQFAPLSILMIDIDLFKPYNDCYGHPAGDDCIRQVATALSDCAKRASDTVARYGGEEFVVILPFCNKDNAEFLAEQMREKVRKLKIPHAGSSVSEYVTISLGVYSAIPTSNSSIEQFVKYADMALYDAKKSRNQVVTSLCSSDT